LEKKAVLKKSLTFGQGAVKKVLDSVQEEDSMHQLYADMNHIRWQTGHLLGSAQAMLRVLKEDVKTPEENLKLFGGGSKISGEASMYPEFSKLRDDLYATWEKVNLALDKTSDEVLDEVITFSEQWKPTRMEALIFLIAHEFYHTGQVVQTLRSLGRERPFA
jgi:uncharacterized damage-inducible protein DinB